VPTGRIGENYQADLVVLDRDPFTGPSEEMGSTTVLATYVAGERVW
jgi:predicted amidohydrolase YtcJ